MVTVPSEELRIVPWMFVILWTANFKFRNHSTCSKEPMTRAGKVCGDSQYLKSPGRKAAKLYRAAANTGYSPTGTLFICQTSLFAKYLYLHYFFKLLAYTHPGDFRYWESPQTLPALVIGSFEHVEWFRNLKFAVQRITNIQGTILSSSEGTVTIHLAFK